MSEASNSCLIEKLSYYIDLDEQDNDHLASLEEVSRSYRRHEEIFSVDDSADHLFVVKTGWLYTYIDMPDGRRQIIKILHPGDIIGFPDIAFLEATATLKASENAVLCPFHKNKLDAIFVQSPRLTALLFTLANRDLACMIDTVRALGRMSARERIAFLLLDLHARLKITDSVEGMSFRLPLNQFEIGDALGLTHTYVSKTVRQMEDEGLIARSGTMVTLSQPETLADMVEFKDRYHDLDTSWFPQSGKT